MSNPFNKGSDGEMWCNGVLYSTERLARQGVTDGDLAALFEACPHPLTDEEQARIKQHAQNDMLRASVGGVHDTRGQEQEAGRIDRTPRPAGQEEQSSWEPLPTLASA